MVARTNSSAVPWLRGSLAYPAGSPAGGPARVAGVVARGAEAAVGLAWDRVRDLAVEIARRAPVRDLSALREQHGGVQGEELADALVEASARATGAVGLVGGVTALRAVVRRSPLVGTLNLAAEGLAVAAVEIKMVAELHEVYGVVVPGGGTQRAGVFARIWAAHRLSDLERSRKAEGLGGPALILARLVARGAADGEATRALARRIRADLRSQGARVD